MATRFPDRNSPKERRPNARRSGSSPHVATGPQRALDISFSSPFQRRFGRVALAGPLGKWGGRGGRGAGGKGRQGGRGAGEQGSRGT